ncbi:hypothetical protein ACHAPO_000163 [Fusarium lateritium]
MKFSLFLTAGSLAWASPSTPKLDYNRAPPNLSTLANLTIYNTWRPRAHVLPPTGQIGDPCMHYTDPKTGLFHVGFLHEGASGATTDDLVTYKDLNPGGAPFIRAGGLNDPVAVFDGSVIPVGINGTPTLFYTSVSYLPIHWTINHTRGAETQSLAVSTDGGRNFTKVRGGPAIPDQPFALNVTAFRDPFVFKNKELDNILESEPGVWYSVISGGVQQKGPSMFLYRQYDPEFQYWEYMGEWWHEKANTTWGEGIWAGRYGFNFEVGNIFSIDEEGYNSDGETFMTFGAEWSEAPAPSQVSQFREMLWAAGNTTMEKGKATFTPAMVGKMDWGHSAYAAAGKYLPSDSKASKKSGAPDRFISYLWLTGDYYGDLKLFPTPQQNWTGALLLPRELTVGKISNVVDNELSREEGSWRVERNESGILELATMKQVIAREPIAEFTKVKPIIEAGRNISKSGSTTFDNNPDSKFYLLKSSISFPKSARDSDLKAGFQILASEKESTTIYYQFSNESIIIDRSNTSAAALTTSDIDSRNEAGRLRLFDVVIDDEEQIETLDLTIVVDNAMVEVHANDRFGVATWARSWYADSTDIRFFHSGSGDVTFSNVTIYEGLADAWPERNR